MPTTPEPCICLHPDLRCFRSSTTGMELRYLLSLDNGFPVSLRVIFWIDTNLIYRCLGFVVPHPPPPPSSRKNSRKGQQHINEKRKKIPNPNHKNRDWFTLEPRMLQGPSLGQLDFAHDFLTALFSEDETYPNTNASFSVNCSLGSDLIGHFVTFIKTARTSISLQFS